MVNNLSIKDLGHMLIEAKSVMLFPHENADGDAVGSCKALCLALRQRGIDCWILCGEPVAKYLSFMDFEYFTTDEKCIENPEICMAVDCSDDQRIPGRVDKFYSGETKLCIDHHSTSGAYGDYYYIDGDEAATGQLVYDLICSMNESDGNIELNSDIADALFTAISSDTGNFKYSNTTSKTHRVVADLMDIGLHHNDIIVNLYQNKNPINQALEIKSMNVMELIADGKAAISYVTKEMMDECGATLENAEEIINLLRDIAGVEIAALLKQKETYVFKGSLRAKSYANVDGVASSFGGGGHAKAAGCTINASLEEALASMKEEIVKAL